MSPSQPCWAGINPCIFFLVWFFFSFLALKSLHTVGSFSCPLCTVVLLIILHCAHLSCSLGKNDGFPNKGSKCGAGSMAGLSYQMSVPVERILQQKLLSLCCWCSKRSRCTRHCYLFYFHIYSLLFYSFYWVAGSSCKQFHSHVILFFNTEKFTLFRWWYSLYLYGFSADYVCVRALGLNWLKMSQFVFLPEPQWLWQGCSCSCKIKDFFSFSCFPFHSPFLLSAQFVQNVVSPFPVILGMFHSPLFVSHQTLIPCSDAPAWLQLVSFLIFALQAASA